MTIIRASSKIAFVDTETGEVGERRLTHREEAEQFYGTLKERSVRVGMEASGHARWFERLLSDLQFELWIGDAAEIRTSPQGRGYWSFAYSALASFRMGMSGSASLQSVRKSL